MWCKNTGTKQCIAGFCPDPMDGAPASCRITCNQKSRLRSRQSVKEEKPDKAKVRKIEQTSDAQASDAQASNANANAQASNAQASDAQASDAQASDAEALEAQASKVRNIERKIEQIDGRVSTIEVEVRRCSTKFADDLPEFAGDWELPVDTAATGYSSDLDTAATKAPTVATTTTTSTTKAPTATTSTTKAPTATTNKLGAAI